MGCCHLANWMVWCQSHCQSVLKFHDKPFSHSDHGKLHRKPKTERLWLSREASFSTPWVSRFSSCTSTIDYFISAQKSYIEVCNLCGLLQFNFNAHISTRRRLLFFSCYALDHMPRKFTDCYYTRPNTIDALSYFLVLFNVAAYFSVVLSS